MAADEVREIKEALYLSDVFTRNKRSAVMSRIRGKGNKATELRLVAIFRRGKITGWRRGSKLVGKPDFVFPKLKPRSAGSGLRGGRGVAVFVDGCFWHGCPKHATWPKQNAAFWRAKILGNRKRDRLVNRTLRKAGWRVIRVWEHELIKKREAGLVRRLQRIWEGILRRGS